MTNVLDNPVWHSIVGAHAHLGRRDGGAVVYDPAVSPFVGMADGTAEDWEALRALLGHRRVGVVLNAEPPEGVRVAQHIRVHQMVAEAWAPEPDPEVLDLGPDDVPEMIDLTQRTKPGPFEERTVDLGRYVGFRVDGRLVAMAGERMHPPGFTEISAVCTDPAFTGRGFAVRAMATIGAGIVARGETPFLHVAHGNPARRLYERLGFVVRRDSDVRAVLDPGGR